MRSTAWRLDRAAGARAAHPGVRISVSAGAEGPRARSRGSRPRGHARGMGRGTHVILGASAKGKELEALIFDCDGVILESEHLHYLAYNNSFQEFQLEVGGRPVKWEEPFYESLQNRVGFGGKPKMRWYFAKYGWPTSTGTGTQSPPETATEQEQLVDVLQDYKTRIYKEMVADVAQPRSGVLRLMNEAREAGLSVAVCSAATKSSVEFTINNLLGDNVLQNLDCFLAGDDVTKKKPDPEIYLKASKKLQVDPKNCMVVEDSMIGLNAALGAGMQCIITYTSSTKDEDFKGAKMVVSALGDDPPNCVTVDTLRECMG